MPFAAGKEGDVTAAHRHPGWLDQDPVQPHSFEIWTVDFHLRELTRTNDL